MRSISDITRQLSYEDIQKKRPTMKQNILNNLDKPMTIQEIADELAYKRLIGTNNRSKVAPRITELEDEGFVKQVGFKKDYMSKKLVTIYAKV